jgi:splicing factor 3B subunit 2
MGLSTAERNRRKRERKKKEKELRRKEDEEEAKQKPVEKTGDDDVEIEYVAETVSSSNGMAEVLLKFQERASVASSVVSDDENKADTKTGSDDDDDDEDNEDENLHSKRKLREILRPSVAELKRRVGRADLVEAHDVTAPDPDFLIYLKAMPGTVPVPRHWGRKRKYLQGKRGFEKQPFQLPDFIIKTGIAELRDTVAENEAGQSAKQSNRGRVAPKMGAMDVDYRTLHEAFFQHQTKPTNLTRQGDLYYEGKEMETKNHIQPGKPLSEKLREALGLTSENMPPPWLVNMQRYGPPPSYPALKIPGLTAPLPSVDCQYGYHIGGWGKPPVDNYGRPLYGGNPFDPPGDSSQDGTKNGLVTSDGKTLESKLWGGLPMGEEERDSDEEDSDEDMDESSDEGEEEQEKEEQEEGEEQDGTVSVLPTITKALPTDLRKDTEETPSAPKQLYTVLEERKTNQGQQQVFGSDVQYVVPGEAGAESVLSKAMPNEPSKKKKRVADEDQEEGLDKNFKF